MNCSSSLSNRPVLIRSEMIIGLEVAPDAPQARFSTTKSGSIESSQSLVPLAIKLFNGEVMMEYPFSRAVCHGRPPNFVGRRFARLGNAGGTPAPQRQIRDDLPQPA